MQQINSESSFRQKVARSWNITFWGFVSGGVKDALTFGLRLMFVDITEP